MIKIRNEYKLVEAEERCRGYRKRILDISQNVSALHAAGAFSCTEIVDTIYYALMRKENNQLTDEFSGLENLARDKFPAAQDYLNKVNAQIRDIDNTMSKEDDLLKGIQVGYSCLIRKGL